MKQWRLVLRVLLLAMSIAVLMCLPCCFAAEPQALMTWGTFETDAAVGKWKTFDTQFERAAEFATGGKHSARLRFRRYGGAKGEAQWPRVTAFADDGIYPIDWTNWAAVMLDVGTDSDQPVSFSIEIRDTRGKNGWWAPYSASPGGTQSLLIPLAEVAKKIDVSHIAEFLIFKSRPEADVNLYVDSVRLVSPALFRMQETVSAAESALQSLWTRNGANADMKDIVAALRKAVSASAIMSLAEVNTCQDRARQVRNQIEARRIKPLFAFDFGPADSPVRKDFVPVSASSAYTAESGFGWRTLEGLREVTQPALREPTSSESYYGREIEPWLYLNALTQDLVGASTSAEFAIRVPPGDYVVWLLAGNPERSGGKMFVNNFSATAGATAQRIGLPQPDIFESLFIPARANADGLTIRFVPETGFVINALAVFAKDDLRRARKEFAGPIEHEVFVAPPELWPKWHRSPNPIENQDAPPASAESARGYVLFTRPFVRNVYPGSRPQADERFERLRAFATPGEYEPFTFAVKPLRDLDGAIVTAEGLRGPQGSRIPAAAIDVRQVRCWPVRGNYNSKDVHRIVPEILDPARPMDLDANVCQRYWLTVHVPDEAAPGMYRGQATIRFENAPTAHIALELEVLPFRLLRDPTKSFGNYYRSPLDKIRANMSGEVVAAIRRRAEAEAIDMREHGMNTLQMSGIGAKKIDGKWEATIDLDERIKFLERFGLWGDAPGVMMGAFFSGSIHRDTTGEARIKHLVGATMPPQEYFDAMTDVIAQVEKVRLARGWPDFYYYPIDEACADAVPILVKTLAAIKKVPTAKTYATQVFQLDHNRALDDVLDVWCSGYFCPDLDAVEAMRKKGRIFWCYPNFVACSRGVPNSARMTYGFALWRMGYSCLIPWHYQAPVGNPFSDFDAHYGDWCMAYPGADGPIPTQRWEAVREGIDDGRYLYTLEARIAAADKAGAAKKAVAAGKALLEEIRAAVPIQAEYGQSGPWQGREYTTYRRRLAAAVMEFD